MAVLLQEVGDNISGGELPAVRCTLKEDNCDRIPVYIILGKGHEHELCKELVIKGFLSKFSVLHSKKCEVHIHVVAISVLLLKHSYFRKECSYTCVRVCMSFQ